MHTWPDRVLFGAAYYHEYQPYDRLKTDLDLMADAHFSVIRVGESVWSTWEPENGRFDLDWLLPVLDGAQERGIGVILGTPTYAVPPWLARHHPEIAGERRTGERIPWGARQEVDFTHPAFLFHAERVIRKIVPHYAGHPAVIGYQVDNEPGLELFHNRGVFQRFVDHLRNTYGDVETLNREWGLVYWSHRLSTWADLWTPDGNVQPQYDLAWRRFQAEQTTDFIGWQADIVREYARPEQFVTTCLSYARPALADDQLMARLDVTAGNPYYEMQDGLQLPSDAGGRVAGRGWTTNATWSLYLTADRMFSSRQEPFLITETNAWSIGMPWTNKPAYDGQWRQVAWALVSRGASMIEYWHWHTLHYGAETYWGGVLPHSGRPGRTYRAIARIGADLEAAGDLLVGVRPDADIAMLYSAPSRWAMEFAPHLANPDGSPDRRAYDGFFDAFYRGAFESGLQVRIVHDTQLAGEDPAELAGRSPVLVVPGLYIADDATLDRLLAYAQAGGHLVLGPRTGYGDQEARARAEVAPGRMVEAVGAWYEEFANLSEPLPVTASDGSPLDLVGAAGTRWADGLHAEGAEILAGYDDQHYGRWAAATTREHGAGRVTYVGTVPNPAFARTLLRWVSPVGEDPWRPREDSITSTSAMSRSGRRLRFLHNWSWRTVTFSVPSSVRDVVSGNSLAAQDQVELGPWDVRVLVEEEN